MKRRLLCAALAAALLLGLTACRKKPTETNTGEAWADEWTCVGSTLGVEEPEGFASLEDQNSLAFSDVYYAAWVRGEAQAYTNANGEAAEIYDAQLYLLLQDCSDEQAAADAVADWQTSEQENVSIIDTRTVNCAGQEYTLLLYEVTAEDNPYAYGAVALGTYGSHAICTELTCQSSSGCDAEASLLAFLEGIHYAAGD